MTVEPTIRLSQLAGKAAEVVMSGVDKAVEQRWERDLEVAAPTNGHISDRINEIASAFAREMAAAVPGAGPITLVGTMAVDLAWFTGRAADLILAVAAVHGQTVATVEQRRAWILPVLAFGDGASVGFTKLAGEVGKGLGRRTTEKIPTELINAINKALGRTIITKYGTKRGVIALGRALPFGIGALSAVRRTTPSLGRSPVRPTRSSGYCHLHWLPCRTHAGRRSTGSQILTPPPSSRTSQQRT